jgi:CubicO group peptidase (beta-lactamase class C family)
MKNIQKQRLTVTIVNLFFKSIFYLIILIGTLCLRPFTGNPIIKEFDDLISVYHNNGEFNGCILVAQNGEVIFEKAYGYCDYSSSKLLTTDYQFRLASVSKQFTAMTIMILKGRNKLQYDDLVVKYLKDFPYKNITIRHLLTHTSGLPDYGNLFEKEREAGGINKQVVSSKDVYDLILKYTPPQKFIPGDEYEYSNTGYVILALLVECISGQSFQSFTAENIFIPLGMSKSYVNPSNGKLNDEYRAKGFIIDLDGNGYVARDWHYQNGIYGDGGVISTIHDLLLWDIALRSGKLVEKSILDEAFTQVKLNDDSSREYGFGWSVIKQDSGIIVAHGGGWLGYTTGIMRDLSTGQTVIQLCNMPSQRLFFPLWDILNGRNVKQPEYVQVTFTVNSDQLTDTNSVFIAGNHKKLGSWNPAKIKLKNIATNLWQRTISLEKGYKIEYKITRGSWNTEAIYEKGVIPANAIFTINADTLIKINAPYWKDMME